MMIKIKDKNILENQNIIQDMNNQLRELEVKIQKMENIIQDKKNMIQDKDNQIQNMENIIQDKENQLAISQVQIENLNDDNKKLMDINTEIKQLNKLLSEKYSQLEAKKEANDKLLQYSKAEIEKLQQLLIQEKENNKLLKEEIQKRIVEIQNLNQTLKTNLDDQDYKLTSLKDDI